MYYYNAYQAGSPLTNALGLSYNGNPYTASVLRAAQSNASQQPFTNQQQLDFYIGQQRANQQAALGQPQLIVIQQQPQAFVQVQPLSINPNQTLAQAQQFVAQQAVPQHFGGQYQAQPRWPGQQPQAIGVVPVTTVTANYPGYGSSSVTYY